MKYLEQVAIVGAGGNLGRFISEALLSTGRHAITALTRVESKNTIPQGVVKQVVDYDEPDTITNALRGQHVLIITLSGHSAIEDIEMKLVRCAEQAGVQWVLRNEWGPDTANEELMRDIPVFQPKAANLQAITQHSKLSYIAICTGYWYEWSLALPSAFGFNIKEQCVTLFDEGKTKICVSTWHQIGRAVAALLSLPLKADQGQRSCLEDFRNQVVYMYSFAVSQQDMLDSILRVTNTRREAWKIQEEPSSKRYLTGVNESKAGKRAGFAKMAYTRVFFPDGAGDFRSKEILNKKLDLAQEDLDEATIRAIERSKLPQWT